MSIKTIFTLTIAILITASVSGQHRQTAEFGKPNRQELAMKTYPKAPEAYGVVLFEKGKYYVEIVNNYVKLIKEVHVKTKVIDAKNFSEATIQIPYYSNKKNGDIIEKITAITHNGRHQTYVKSEDIFDADEGQNYSVKKFTFPNVKDGSILEYTYKIESHHYSAFGGWRFQGPLPVMYSEFESEIPGNYEYRRSLIGNQKLEINEVTLKKDCFYIPGYEVPADCEVSLYVMKNVPAFKEEKYMLSESNYIARIDFELVKSIDFNGNTERYAKDWDDVDKVFRYDKDMGRQLKYKSYFEDKLPQNIITIGDDLDRAKAVYYFIQDHFAWNGEYRIFSEIRVKQAFEDKSGNNSEINLALINAMEAANLDVKLMLLSTRANGLPREAYPVYTDFNYAIGLLKIGDNEYLLDATNKLNPFGIIPFRALNLKGRVMDFKNGSYWHPITPNPKNIAYVNAQLKLDENFVISGKVNEVSIGYAGVSKRNDFSSEGSANYVKEKQKTAIGMTINDFSTENFNDLEQPFKEIYNVTFEPENAADQVFFYPYFLGTYFSENPFKLDVRNYPIEFGFPISNTYMLSLDLNNIYEVIELPKSRIIKLPQDAGECSVIYNAEGGKLNLRYNLKINEARFGPEAYISLKEFFNNLVILQSKEPVVLKKN